ncbi:MAG: DUF2520 domain-containing protein [Candidatus Protistobacter heckmanni]|nr:DUF2520 domain-containing protein [Candidatus Protistobacter heckmanni]
MPALGFIGAGRIAQALARGFSAAGLRVAAVASRTPDSARKLAQVAPGCIAVATPQDVLAHADLVFLTVPDDAIAATAAALRLGPGQALVHCSGASEIGLLEPAARGAADARIGGFHPLYQFASLEDDARNLAGCSITIEATEPLAGRLRDLAVALSCKPLRIPPDARMLYHASAAYGAGYVLALLSEAVAVWNAIGLDEQQTLDAMWPMIEGSIASARKKGLSGALAGPISRGDAGVVAKQAALLGELGGDHAQLFAALGKRALALTRRRPAAAQPPEAALEAIEASLDAAARQG